MRPATWNIKQRGDHFQSVQGPIDIKWEMALWPQALCFSAQPALMCQATLLPVIWQWVNRTFFELRECLIGIFRHMVAALGSRREAKGIHHPRSFENVLMLHFGLWTGNYIKPGTHSDKALWLTSELPPFEQHSPVFTRSICWVCKGLLTEIPSYINFWWVFIKFSTDSSCTQKDVYWLFWLMSWVFASWHFLVTFINFLLQNAVLVISFLWFGIFCGH